MTVTVTVAATSAGQPVWLRLSGTIQEVLDEAAGQNLSAGSCVYWSDDGTDAKAVYCRQR